MVSPSLSVDIDLRGRGSGRCSRPRPAAARSRLIRSYGMGGRAITAALLVVGLLTALACGSNRPSGAGADSGELDGSLSAAGGGNSLSGTYAFPVQSSLVSAGEGTAECGYAGPLPGGGYADFEVVLLPVDVGDVCADGSTGNSLRGKPFVVLQIKSSSYATDLIPDAGLVSVVPGTYPVDFENLDDDDLCMARPNTALVDVRDYDQDASGAVPVASAYSGSVTFTTIETGHVVGSFDVQMATLHEPTFDTTNLTPLSGTFDATGCAGL
jgi:hypothetical protein